MGRQPCCEKVGLKRGPWAVEEDRKLVNFITRYGHGCWREVPKLAGLLRCGKSCRLRWTNYLRPDLKRGQLSDAEEKLIIDLHAAIGNRWSRIAAQLPGRTDNEIKNYWNTRIRKKLKQMGIDPVTHKPLSESFDQQQQKRKINKIINKKLGSSESQLESTNTASTIIKDHGNSQLGASGEGKGSVSKATTSGAIGLSKKEKMEVESREAHIKVQKMRAALRAFNDSTYSPPSVISSPTSSAITLHHNTGNEDLDDCLFIDPSRVRDSIINNIISAKRPFFKDHPYFPFSQALESSPSSSMQTISQDCYMFENPKERDNVEFNYGNQQALRSFVYEDKPHFNDWFSAQTFPEAVVHTSSLELASSMAAPSASSHYQNPTQGPASYQWKDALGWEDTKPSMENCSPCSTLPVPSLESSISSSLALAPSNSSGASSWNSIMQHLLEDGSMPCGSLDSKTATLTPGIATFAPSELQQLASLLDEI